jgi:hypothetical protein
VRRWPGWYRHITLALLAQAFLVVTRTKAGDQTMGRGRLTSQLGLLPSPSPRSTMAPLDRQPIPAGGREPDLIPKCGRSSK